MSDEIMSAQELLVRFRKPVKIYSQSNCEIIIQDWDEVLKWKKEMQDKGYYFTNFSWSPHTGKIYFDYEFTQTAHEGK